MIRFFPFFVQLVLLTSILQAQTYAIKNVNVLPMTSPGEELTNATVVVANKKIVSINAEVPKEAKVIDGTGKWLIPGLIDMHVHIPSDSRFGSAFPSAGANVFFNTQDNMTPFIANGVTTIFELNARPEHFGQRNEIERGAVIGPRIALAALINGGEGSGRLVNNAADGRQAVRSAKAEGYEFMKVYSALNIETYTAIIEEAASLGMKVIGHIPNAFKGKLNEAFVPGFAMVAHAEEFAKQTDSFSEQRAATFAQMMKANGTWLLPTLITMVRIAQQAESLDTIRASVELQYVHPLLQSKWLTANSYNRNTSPARVTHLQTMVAFNTTLVKAAKAARVPIVAGTDAGTSGVVWGFSLHDELKLLVNAGLTPEEVLLSATQLPAKWLGIDSVVGTVTEGKYADLILLDADPRSDIGNTKTISAVFVNGRFVSRVQINKMLADLSKRNTARKKDFDWKKMAR